MSSIMHLSDTLGMPACGKSRAKKRTIRTHDVTCLDCNSLLVFKRDVTQGIMDRGGRRLATDERPFIYTDAFEIETIAGKLLIDTDVAIYGWIAQRFDKDARPVPGANPHSGKWNYHPGRESVIRNPVEAAKGYLAFLDTVLPSKEET